MLNGRPIKDHDFMTRMFNAVSPISLNLDNTPGRRLLFDSGYDTRLSTYYAPDGTNLTDSPEIRSMFQQAIGRQNLERQLDKLSENPKVLASLETMHRDIRSGNRGEYEGADYFHNKKIDALFQRARRAAWSSIMRDPRIQSLMTEQREAKKKRYRKTKETTNTQTLLSIYK
jgi:hypothetical protein